MLSKAKGRTILLLGQNYFNLLSGNIIICTDNVYTVYMHIKQRNHYENL